MKKSATSKRKKRAFISAILMSMTFMFSCDLSAQPEAIPESKILNWNKAGRSAFIPDAPSVFDSSSMVAVNLKASGTASTTEIQKAIKAAKNTKKRWVWLPNARYFVNAPIKMEPNVALLGQSKSGVVLLMRLTSGNAISMFKDDNSGVSRLTLLGSYRMHDDSILDRDPINFWSCPSCNEQDSISTISIRINRSSQCWVDDVEIINSGRHPLVLGPTAQNNTIRNVYARGAHNKGGGANGYFFIQGSYNLITKCRATHLRHISIQGSSAEWNVLYNNDFEQEVSFHVGDNGNNLLERNTITLPEDMPDAYYAVMGTWSTQHDKGKINYLYRNALTQLNRDPIRLFSGQASEVDGVVFEGPLTGKKEATAAGLLDQYDHGNNFRPKYKAPTSRSIYTGKYSLTTQTPVVTVGLDNKGVASEIKPEVYPNPSSDIIFVTLHDGITQVEAKLYNFSGDLVLSQHEMKRIDSRLLINIKALKDGVYFLKINDHTSRVIINKSMQ